MQFTKMQGIGNDYIYVNLFMEHVAHPSDLSRHISDRHFGIGSDGLVLIGPSDKADLRMQMFNADGSEGKMCGNACRCIGRYAYERGLTDRTTFTLETGSGIRTISLNVVEGKVQSAVVDMGEPIFTAEEIPTTLSNPNEDRVLVNGVTWPVTSLSMGNPHCVIFTDEDTRTIDLPHIGPMFENHPTFPQRTNTEFANILDRKNIRMRVWERGSGETLACGTGACATTVAAVVNGLTDEEVTMHLLGGELTVRYDRENDTVWLKGPATTVFTGHIDIPESFERDDVKIYEPKK